NTLPKSWVDVDRLRPAVENLFGHQQTCCRPMHQSVAAEAGADEQSLDLGKFAEYGLVVRHHLVESGPLRRDLGVAQKRQALRGSLKMAKPPLLIDRRIETRPLVVV